MSSPVPSPVPAGTEREALLLDALWRLYVAASMDADNDQQVRLSADYAAVGAALAAVVSSSPATPSREWRLFNEPSTIGPWDIEDPAPSPASPAETRAIRAAREVMAALEEHGPGIVGHLLDDDDNAGERLRQALRDIDDPLVNAPAPSLPGEQPGGQER